MRTKGKGHGYNESKYMCGPKGTWDGNSEGYALKRRGHGQPIGEGMYSRRFAVENYQVL